MNNRINPSFLNNNSNLNHFLCHYSPF
jgi:hypothetical protein